MGRISDTIKHLIILNALFFIATYAIGDIVRNEMALYYPSSENFAVWQFVTHMFMHGSFMHILFNMYGLWAFGSPLEQMWGRNKFLFFYFSTGIGAGLIYTGVNYFQFHQVYQALLNLGLTTVDIQEILSTGKYNQQLLNYISADQLNNFYTIFHTPAVGASGALYGVLVAFAMMFPNAELMLIFVPFPIKAKFFIPIIVGLDLISGVTGVSIFGGGIAHFAHVGGAIIGYIMMRYWKSNQFNRWDL